MVNPYFEATGLSVAYFFRHEKVRFHFSDVDLRHLRTIASTSVDTPLPVTV